MINIVLSVLIYDGLCFFDVPVIRIFNREPELIKEATAALPLFALSFVPMALNLSTQRTSFPRSAPALPTLSPSAASSQ